jgi:asparagine N-glycosylation enzyme membrane subunit Stt3
MSHNGVDIDQYILLIIYPSIAFFATGFITRKIELKKSITYVIQAIICFGFSIAYYVLIPYGGALGLSIILGLFGFMLLVIARKEKLSPSDSDMDGMDTITSRKDEEKENSQVKSNKE